MLSSSQFIAELKKSGFNYFAGVPDSLLKPFCQELECFSTGTHRISANEGGALALATGYHLATGGIPVVYLQNSGLGNIVNPCLSITSPFVYNIPVLYIVGWRGQPGTVDEPQHLSQGGVTETLLADLGIQYEILSKEPNLAGDQILKAKTFTGKNKSFAFLVNKGTFQNTIIANEKKSDEKYAMKRSQVLEEIISQLNDDFIIVSTTGKTSRELYEIRENNGMGHERDFLNVGGMGHASQIALAIAENQDDKKVLCLDGDGAVLMHMGALAINGTSGISNFYHLLINNGAHESVGGMKTIGYEVDFTAIAQGCSYGYVDSISSQHNLTMGMENFLGSEGPSFLEIRVCPGSNPDLLRPKESPEDRKKLFVKNIR
jgi:phosphonopyruvate decarboxylase